MDAEDYHGARVVVRTELRTHTRRLRENTRQTLAVLAWIVIFGIIFPLVLQGVVSGFSQELVSGRFPRGSLGALFLGFVVGGFYLGILTTFSDTDPGAVYTLIRTSIAPPAVALGRLVNGLSQVLLFLVLPAFLGFEIELGLDTGSPLPPVLLGIALLPVLAGPFLVGRATGAFIQYAGLTAHLGGWGSRLLRFVLVGLVYLVFRLFISPSGQSPGLGSLHLQAFIPGQPFQAYASLMLAPLGGTPTLLGVLALGVFLVGLAGGFAATLRLETALLLRESDSTSEPEQADESTTTHSTRSTASTWGRTPRTRMAFRYLVRTRRDPGMITHLFPLSFVVFSLVAGIISSPGTISLVGGPACVIGGAVIAGEAYCLNPLGDDSDQLPLVLTSAPSPRLLLQGRAFAGILPGLVLGGIGIVLSALHGSLGSIGETIVLTAVLIPAAAGSALGLGAFTPSFERRSYMSVERAHPSRFATIGFLFATMIIGGIGFGLIWWPFPGVSLLIEVIAWAVYLLVVTGSGVTGYLFAVEVFDDLTLDDI